MARHLGGITRYGRDTPIPVTTVLDVLGVDDALWALFVVDEVRWRHFALDCATRVLRIFEDVRPDDSRPRDAIVYYRANPSRPRLSTGGGAAGAAWAVRAAKASEAASAARAAGAARTARAASAAEAAAEAEWQEKRLRRYLTGRRPQPLPLPPRVKPR
jgi:hypothetical protein